MWWHIVSCVSKRACSNGIIFYRFSRIIQTFLVLLGKQKEPPVGRWFIYNEDLLFNFQ